MKEDVSLILLPAVDVIEGRAVRLVQGKAGSETEYGTALEAASVFHFGELTIGEVKAAMAAEGVTVR